MDTFDKWIIGIVFCVVGIGVAWMLLAILAEIFDDDEDDY